MRIPTVPAGIALALLLFGCGNQRTAEVEGGWSAARIDSLNALMPDLLRKYAVPGAAIALAHESGIKWTSGYGVTASGGGPVTPATVFQAASLSKPVFAQLVARIAAARGWSLGDAIAEWAATRSYREDLGSLSAAEILSHTSGFVYDAASSRVGLDPELRGEWQYSGAAYVLLQRILEAGEGKGLEVLAQEWLFRPLGMENTSFISPGKSGCAHGHARDGRSLREAAWEQANAASSLHTSALDYARFLIHASGLGASAPESWEHMTTARVTVRKDLGLRWGLGWAIEQASPGGKAAFHWGSNPGFKSFALVDRRRNLALVMLTNGDNGLELVERAVAIVDPRHHPLFKFYMLHPDD